MEKNVLKLTDQGRQAANNASAGGLLVDLVQFKAGTSNATALATDLDIKGTEVYAGSITYVEVLDETSVRFRFDIPEHVAPEEGIDINEVAVYLPSNVMFGRCVLIQSYHLNYREGVSIDCVLTTHEFDVSILNVVIGDYVSVPSTPFVRRLPDPSSADHNTINVLDLIPNSDTSFSAGLAMRFGQGSMHWAFSGFDRIYHGTPDDGTTTQTEFGVEAVVDTFNIRNAENVIVQVVSGPGQGETRRYRYDAVKLAFEEVDGEPFSSFGPSSYISIWRKIGGNTTLKSTLPNTDNIPANWVLTRGPDDQPVWAPVNVGGRNINTLYRSPGKLRITPLTHVGDAQTARYTLTGLEVKNANHVITALGSVTQHRNAFEVQGNELEFADNIPASVGVDIRAMTKEPSTGHYVNIETDTYVSDGNTLRYRISQAIEGPQYAMVYIRGGLQSLTSYSYDAQTQEIVFTQKAKAGLEIEISTIALREDEGWSCDPTSATIYTTGDTHFLELPVVPQSKHHTFISVNGVHLHRNAYSLVEDKVILSSPVPKGRMVESHIIHNYRAEGTPQTNLDGVITDAVLTHKALHLLRHGDSPIRLPIPGVSLDAGRGIRVTGIHPNYKIESTLAETFSEGSVFNFSTLKTEENAEEIIFTQRVDVTNDMMLQVTADFSAILGTGFFSAEGREKIQFVVGFRTTSAKEPDYGRRIKGTGEAGFAALEGTSDRKAYSNASLTQTYSIQKANMPAGYIDIVARMRVRDANVSQYGSLLSLNMNILGMPKV